MIIELKYTLASALAETDVAMKNNILSMKADGALEQIQKNDYARQYQLKAKKIIEMGLSVYGRGEVMLKFGTPAQTVEK